eukprot:TRINITY_DN8110_c0_g1_i5.p1 TRINITY_DN8110_c0_g1~~TRINITY_DN8110_c0_g1_i5.p1  ORF type:complete len:148 (-),score=28.10 TRINITY_DN8110_c0_g1_i5:332-736(-)
MCIRDRHQLTRNTGHDAFYFPTTTRVDDYEWENENIAYDQSLEESHSLSKVGSHANLIPQFRKQPSTILSDQGALLRPLTSNYYLGKFTQDEAQFGREDEASGSAIREGINSSFIQISKSRYEHEFNDLFDTNG